MPERLPVVPAGFEAKYSDGRWSLEHRDSGFQLNKDSLSVYREAVEWVATANNIPRAQANEARRVTPDEILKDLESIMRDIRFEVSAVAHGVLTEFVRMWREKADAEPRKARGDG